jgi:hypothetical protein
MISKNLRNRRNRISKKNLRTRRNRISKSRRITGGKKGDVHTWNLGLFTLKIQKGFIMDDYWIEYPTDPLPEGWTQIPPTGNTGAKWSHDSILPSYSDNGDNKKPQLIRPIDDKDYKKITDAVPGWTQIPYYLVDKVSEYDRETGKYKGTPNVKSDYEKIVDYFYYDADNKEIFKAHTFDNAHMADKMIAIAQENTANRIKARKTYNSILRNIQWKELKEVPNSKKTSLNSFLESNIFTFSKKRYQWKENNEDFTIEQWSVQKKAEHVYMCILDVDEAEVPDEFKKLHKTVHDRNLKPVRIDHSKKPKCPDWDKLCRFHEEKVFGT